MNSDEQVQIESEEEIEKSNVESVSTLNTDGDVDVKQDDVEVDESVVEDGDVSVENRTGCIINDEVVPYGVYDDEMVDGVRVAIPCESCGCVNIGMYSLPLPGNVVLECESCESDICVTPRESGDSTGGVEQYDVSDVKEQVEKAVRNRKAYIAGDVSSWKNRLELNVLYRLFHGIVLLFLSTPFVFGIGGFIGAAIYTGHLGFTFISGVIACVLSVILVETIDLNLTEKVEARMSESPRGQAPRLPVSTT